MVLELSPWVEETCASIIDGIELRWWPYCVIMHCEKNDDWWKLNCSLYVCLSKFDEYWDESNPRAEISVREKKNVAEISTREKENVAEISAKEKRIWPRLQQKKKKRAGTPTNLRGCEFDKQTLKR